MTGKITYGNLSPSLQQRIDTNTGGGGSVDIINDLITGGATKALSAEQGVFLKGNLDGLQNSINSVESSVSALKTSSDATALEVGTVKTKLDELSNDPVTTSKNGLMLSSDKVKLDSLSNQVATTSSNGLMSSVDKTKLDSVTTDVATTSKNGLMSKEDKTKLDSLDPNGGGLTPTLLNATITTTWTGSLAPYTQNVTVTGLLSTDFPDVVPVYSASADTAVKENTAWNNISSIVAYDGYIKVSCFETQPITAINVKIRVWR